MMGRFFDWTARNVSLCIGFLTLVVAANVLFQAYTHKTTPLLAWKGGGFGMYTEPHVEDRSVWLTFQGADGEASVRIWPETPEFAAWQAKAGLRGTSYLSNLLRSAERFLYYPRDNDAEELIGFAARVRWPESMVGTVQPIEGTVFDRKDIAITVYENRYDVSAQQVNREAVYRRSGGGQ